MQTLLESGAELGQACGLGINFYFRLCGGSMRSPSVIELLDHRQRHLPSKRAGLLRINPKKDSHPGISSLFTGGAVEVGTSDN